ncbi:DUF4328 domain-containing protein [Streptomyces sp. RGM 3693]|uniref:DUF4328 domain-containing protein n=1 Tax=Streptomyces sp. RGM 3693 TaxID=3413284 RepID=UPI003D288F73
MEFAVSHHPVGAQPDGPVLRSTKGLATAITVLLLAFIAIDLFSLYAGLNMHSLMGKVISDGFENVYFSEITWADTLYGTAGVLQVLGMIATGTCFLIWFYRARVNADVLAPGACTTGKGWAIGSWFIPIGNYWLPLRVARQVWDASFQDAPEGSRRAVSRTTLFAWWITWAASDALGIAGARLNAKVEGPQSLQYATRVEMVSDAINIAAAVLAILVVRKLTRRQRTHPQPEPVALTHGYA